MVLSLNFWFLYLFSCECDGFAEADGYIKGVYGIY